MLTRTLLTLGPPRRNPRWPIFLIATAQLILHGLTNTNYGIFRDELYYLDCAAHPDWGYVDHPPLSIWLLTASRFSFGDSIQAIRVLSELAGAALIIVTALIAEEMGGRRPAQIIAALCTALAPALLIETGFFSMNAFDLLAWAILFLIVTLQVTRPDPRRWLTFGLVAGLGLLNKISVLFLGAGVAVAILLTPLRSQLRHWQLYAAAGIAAALFLPYILWNAAHDWPTREFMANARQFKIAILTPLEFLGQQLLGMSPLLAPVWLIGLAWLLLPGHGAKFRPLAVTYLVVLAILMFTKSKPYYVFPAYPPLFAAGGCAIERLSLRFARGWPAIAAGAWVLLAGLLTVPIAVPLLSPRDFVRYQELLGMKPHAEEKNAVGEMPQYFADRFGWENIARSVAEIYRTLPASEKPRCLIFGSNYGETGAINYFGSQLGLPRAVSGHNNHFYWPPQNTDPAVVIRIGGDEERLKTIFREVQVATIVRSQYAIPFESNLPIFICRGLKIPFADAWRYARKLI